MGLERPELARGAAAQAQAASLRHRARSRKSEVIQDLPRGRGTDAWEIGNACRNAELTAHSRICHGYRSKVCFRLRTRQDKT
eukprot:2844175-Prymnesium_polylepis.2